jgi:hypothetical protein
LRVWRSGGQDICIAQKVRSMGNLSTREEEKDTPDIKANSTKRLPKLRFSKGIAKELYERHRHS